MIRSITAFCDFVTALLACDSARNRFSKDTFE
jgi:hypothetical protein